MFDLVHISVHNSGHFIHFHSFNLNYFIYFDELALHLGHAKYIFKNWPFLSFRKYCLVKLKYTNLYYSL